MMRLILAVNSRKNSMRLILAVSALVMFLLSAGAPHGYGG